MEEIEHDTKLNGLMLSRTRVMNDLETACNPRYKEQLLQALAFLDHEIAVLDPGSISSESASA